MAMAYSYTTWSPDLKTGNAVVDDQHRRLIVMVNDLYNTQKQGKGKHAVTGAMKFLLEYTVKHFADEETLQQEHDYPDYAVHKQQHDEFRSVAQAMAIKMDRDGPTDEFVNHVCVTVGRWVMNHIKRHDLKMVEYIRKKDEEAMDKP